MNRTRRVKGTGGAGLESPSNVIFQKVSNMNKISFDSIFTVDNPNTCYARYGEEIDDYLFQDIPITVPLCNNCLAYSRYILGEHMLEETLKIVCGTAKDDILFRDKHPCTTPACGRE